MSTYNQIAWLPLCAGVTGLGLVLSWFAMRRRGLRAGLFGTAWSLLPLAAYLTGSILMFWRMGVAIGDFAKGFAFSAKVWSGIAVAALSLVLFVVSGGLRRRRKTAKNDADAAGVTPARGTTALGGAGRGPAPAAPGGALASAPGGALATVPGATTGSAEAAKLPRRRKAASSASDDDDMQDVEEILRRRGIS